MAAQGTPYAAINYDTLQHTEQISGEVYNGVPIGVNAFSQVN